jgi:bifunctional non-homologous end joining protein LigD
MEAIAAGKGKKPKPFMVESATCRRMRSGGNKGLAAEERKTDTKTRKKPAPAKVAESAMPDFVAPQLCETRERPPSADSWIHEIKFDGYRIQIHREWRGNAEDPQGPRLDGELPGHCFIGLEPARCDHRL